MSLLAEYEYNRIVAITARLDRSGARLYEHHMNAHGFTQVDYNELVAKLRESYLEVISKGAMQAGNQYAVLVRW